MPYNESARDKKVRARLEAWPVQQFGQSADYSAFDGATACTHVCWQKIAYIWTGKKYSIDAISRMAGYYRETGSSGPRGLRVSESLKVIDALNLPYVFRSTLTWEQLWALIDKGPVVYATRYGSQPDWRGYTYRGIKADGNPAASPSRTGGRNSSDSRTARTPSSARPSARCTRRPAPRSAWSSYGRIPIMARQHVPRSRPST